MGFGGLVNRHGNFAVRSADVRRVFRAFGNFRACFDDLQSSRLELALGRYNAAAAWVAARDGIPPVSLGRLQRNDDDVSCSDWGPLPICCQPKPGMRGSASSSSTTACDTSARSRRFSFTNIRRRGSISGTSTTSMRIIFRTRSRLRRCIGSSALIWRHSFPITAKTFGGSRLRIRQEAMWYGADHRRPVQSMEQ